MGRTPAPVLRVRKGKLKQRGRRRQRERRKSNRINEHKNRDFARVARVLVHFFTVTVRLRRETSELHVSWRTKTQSHDFIFPSLKLNRDWTPGKFAKIWQIERDGISSDEVWNSANSFLIHVYLAVAVVEFENLSLSKWGQEQNLSHENEFYLNENKKKYFHNKDLALTLVLKRSFRTTWKCPIP